MYLSVQHRYITTFKYLKIQNKDLNAIAVIGEDNMQDNKKVNIYCYNLN